RPAGRCDSTGRYRAESLPAHRVDTRGVVGPCRSLFPIGRAAAPEGREIRSMSSESPRTLLWRLAERRSRARGPALRYDNERQVSQVREHGEWVDSWAAAVLAGTKKFDVETGEDAKGE